MVKKLKRYIRKMCLGFSIYCIIYCYDDLKYSY